MCFSGKLLSYSKPYCPAYNGTIDWFEAPRCFHQSEIGNGIFSLVRYCGYKSRMRGQFRLLL